MVTWWAPIEPAITGPSAMVASRVIRTDDMTNAKTRPRSWSETSWPIMVKPLIQAMPANSPSMIAAIAAPTKSPISDITTSITPAAPMELVKIVRLGTVGSTFGPISMPSASPVNTEPNRIP